ncbi:MULTISPECIES: glycosyltransferase [unclassified Flavobacterium]|uniref:glycosyltransferase n=1 Tax=unclassified Flavobacterium TaxID=196869 RepID=UPI000EB279BA|nr:MULTISPECIES: glycosyltransferase [unclassified Flavobacterium]RKS01089.1 dolichol-phosphate mannosyltransferase [Flavobacterium sp. 102]
MINKEKKVVSAVLYLYNNENVIVPFVKKIADALEALFEKIEIVIVNDASTDSSVELIKKNSELKNYTISIVQMSFHQGIEVSMTAGVDLSLGDFIYEFDDLLIDYDISLIEKSYRQLIEGNDIVTVSPLKSNSLMSTLFYKVYNYFSLSRYKIQSDRFRVLSRRSINRAYSISKSIPYRKALYANSGLKISSIDYVPNQNREKSTNLFRNKMAINTLIIYTNLAFRISIAITMLLFLFTLGTVFYTLMIYFSNQKPIEGWTTLMILISGSFSGLFFLLAIIIKYLSLLVELVYSKKVYLYESIETI